LEVQLFPMVNTGTLLHIAIWVLGIAFLIKGFNCLFVINLFEFII